MGTGRATQGDVAREAGVSRALVSIAFRGVPGVSSETRELIFDAADRIGYRPNAIASRLASRQADVIGLYLLDLRNEIFADIYEGVREGVLAADYQLVLGVGALGGARDRTSLDTLVSTQVDLIIAAGVVLPDAQLQQLSRRVPLITVTRAVPGVDSVYSDDALGARKATEYLLGLGHRRVAHVASPATEGYTARQDAYSEAMRAAGLAPQIVHAAWTQDAAAAAVGPLLDSADRPTAIFANNDAAALGVLDAMHVRGLHAPHDVSVVGYDNTPIGRLPALSLTSVDLHAGELGRRAAAAARRRLTEPDAPRIDDCSTPTLIVRGSTAPLGDASA